MKETQRELLELARIDERHASVQRERSGLPTLRGSLESEREEVRRRLAQAREVLAADEHLERELESNLADTEATLERLRGQQYQVESNEAYRALLNEMEAAESSISQRETEILEMLDRVDGERSDIERLETEAREQEARLEEQLGALEARGELLAKEEARLLALRSEGLARLDRETASLYQRIAAHKRPAAVVVSGDVCPGCQVGIPPQSVLEMLACERIIICGSCHRIQVHERVVEG